MGRRAVFRAEPGAAAQARAFGAVCLAFLLGAALGALLTAALGNRAAWAAALLLCAGLLLFVLDERPRRRSP
ncbi:hypothetical protein [Amycolatopsis samaneae]|uniref:hypothetical protein n=1 Tax=Amycolatopsis samaneae TaxID=664691 RepID=UPI003617565B